MTDTIEAQAATDVREVRQNARDVIHRTATPRGERVHTLCEQVISHTVRDPRVWQGSSAPTLTECAECFAPEATDDLIRPGDLVTVQANTTGRLPSNPRGWTEEKVYVYVGPARQYDDRSIVLVEDGWRVADNTDRMPVGSEAAELATPRMEAWSVQTPLLQHAPAGTDADEVLEPRIRRARNRLIAARPVPETRDADTTTTESETTPVPEPTSRFTVGENLHPLSFETLRDLPRGSVLTITSRPRGTLNTPYVQFGCQSWALDVLQRAHATMTFTTEGTSVTCDYTHDGRNTGEITVLGNRIDLGEFNNYAASVIIKELATVIPDNAFVMEHGFYGCAAHDNCVIFVGNGHPNGSRQPLPVTGRLNRGGSTEVSNRLTGTVGMVEGLRNRNLRECTPVNSPTTAVTMNLTAERRWSLVPCTPEQIERNAALPRYRMTVAAMEAERVTLCSSEGTPV